MATIIGTYTPTFTDIIKGELPISSQFYRAGKIDTERIQDGTSISIFVNLTGLQSQTKYQIEFVARSYYGEYSKISQMNIQTSPMSEGVDLIIPTIGEVDYKELIEAISIVIPINKERLFFNGAEVYPSESISLDNPVIGTQVNEYRVSIHQIPSIIVLLQLKLHRELSHRINFSTLLP